MPENYQGAYADLLYGISDANPQQPVEVAVYGESAARPVGVKRLRGQAEYTVNIAPYMRRQLDPVPQYMPRCVVYNPEGRVAEGQITVGTETTAIRCFTAGIKGARMMELMSEAPLEQSIAPGETDELSVIAPFDEPTFFYGYLYTEDNSEEFVFSRAALGTGKPFCLAVNMDEVAQWAAVSGRQGSLEGYAQLVVCLERNGVVSPVRRYRLRRPDGRTMRLCWVNPLGGIDFYTFAVCAKTTVTAEKSRAYTRDGFTVYGSHGRTEWELRSQYEGHTEAEWLAGVIASPRVWICRGQSFVPADVVTDRIEFSAAAPVSITIRVRESKSVTYQKA